MTDRVSRQDVRSLFKRWRAYVLGDVTVGAWFLDELDAMPVAPAPGTCATCRYWHHVIGPMGSCVNRKFPNARPDDPPLVEEWFGCTLYAPPPASADPEGEQA